MLIFGSGNGSLTKENRRIKSVHTASGNYNTVEIVVSNIKFEEASLRLIGEPISKTNRFGSGIVFPEIIDNAYQ